MALYTGENQQLYNPLSSYKKNHRDNIQRVLNLYEIRIFKTT